MNTSDKVEVNPFHECGELTSEWTLWWRYSSQNRKQGYDTCNLQAVFSFKDLNVFSQIWNDSCLGKVSNFFYAEKNIQKGTDDFDFQN